MKFNYHNKKFRPVQNSANGETSGDTLFLYKQEGQILTSEYSGGKIKKGHLIGWVDENGHIDMRYHQINSDGHLMTGQCFSRPEIMKNGKIRLHESWEWTSGPSLSLAQEERKGHSIIEEIDE